MDDATELRSRIVEAAGEAYETFESADVLTRLAGETRRRGPLLATAAGSAYAARETFTMWSFSHGDHRFRRRCAEESDVRQGHFERVGARYEGSITPPTEGDVHEFLRGRETTTARVAAGFVGRSVVAARVYEHAAAHFADVGDSELETLFDGLASDERRTVTRGLDLLAAADGAVSDDCVALAAETIELAAADLR